MRLLDYDSHLPICMSLTAWMAPAVIRVHPFECPQGTRYCTGHARALKGLSYLQQDRSGAAEMKGERTDRWGVGDSSEQEDVRAARQEWFLCRSKPWRGRGKFSKTWEKKEFWVDSIRLSLRAEWHFLKIRWFSPPPAEIVLPPSGAEEKISWMLPHVNSLHAES